MIDKDVPPIPGSLIPFNENQENDVDTRLPIPIQSIHPSQSRISIPATIITANFISK